MRIEIVWPPSLVATLKRMEKIMGAVADTLGQVTAQLDKVRSEILGELDQLHTQLASAGKLDAADAAAIEAVKERVQALDDIVPDAPAPQPAAVEPEGPEQPPV